jgi:hypothetical protein
MRTLTAVFSLGCLMGSLAPSGFAQERVTFRFTPPMGQVSRYRMENTTWMQNPMMPSGDPSQPTMIMRAWTTQTITAVEGTVRTQRTVTDSMTMDMPGMAAMMPPQARDMMNQQFQNMRGMAVVQRIDERGRTQSVQVEGGNLPPMAREQMNQAGGMGGGFGRGGMPIFPEQGVRVGETWTDSQTISMDGGGMGRGMPGGAGGRGASAGWNITFRLERVENRAGSRVAVVSFNGTMGATGQAPGRQGMGPQSMSGTMSGEFLVDLGRSRLHGMRMEMNAQMGQMGTMRSQMNMELIGT